MKIAYFSNEYPPLIYGGLGVYVDNISRGLALLGQRISVFAWGDGIVKKYEDLDGVEAFRETPVPMRDGLEVFLSDQTRAWGAGLNFLLDLLSYNQLSVSKALEEGPYDLCVAQDWLGLPAAMAAKAKGMPMIYHVHGLEIGRSSHPNPQLVELEKRGARVADMVITVSEAMKQQLREMGVPEEKVRVCYHGVDAEFFDPGRADPKKLRALREKYGIGDDDRVILFIGRLEPVKGVAQLIEAMAAVALKNPNAKLLIVGKGSLEAIAKEAAESKGFVILVTDFLDPEAKMLHYALADLCVFPSHYEPFGIVALEAGAMARPVVVGASGTSGLREIAQNPASKRPTGVHVDGRRPEDIAWGINLALEDQERLKAWGKNARELVLERFTWEKAAEQTLAIYEEVVARRS